MSDQDIFAVGRTGNAVGIGGTTVNVINQDGVDVLSLRHIDDGHRIRIDPALFEVCHWKLIASKQVRNISVPSIRRDCYPANIRAAIGKFNVLDYCLS